MHNPLRSEADVFRAVLVIVVGAAAVMVCTTVDEASDTDTVTGAGVAAVLVVFDEDAVPMATPMSTSNSDSRKMSHRTLLRCAPSAMRMPTSLVRPETA